MTIASSTAKRRLSYAKGHKLCFVINIYMLDIKWKQPAHYPNLLTANPHPAHRQLYKVKHVIGARPMLASIDVF